MRGKVSSKLTHQESKPRVCFLTESFYPIQGGGEIHARLLGEVLIENGFNVFVVTRKTTPELDRCEVVGKIRIYRVPPVGVNVYAKYLMMLPAFIRLLQLRHRYDLLYVFGLRVMGVVGVLVSILLKKKCILRAESCMEMSGDYIWQSPNLPRSKLAQRAIKTLFILRNHILRRADYFVSISQAIEDEYQKCGIASWKIKRIVNGIDVERFKPVNERTKKALRDKLHLPSKMIYTYTGKLNRGKGLDLLLQTWERVISDHPHVHLALVGSGANQVLSIEKDLRLFVRDQNLQDHVTFVGSVENVEEYLQCSDCFILPSESEGLPISLLEAVACGLPAIATNAGGIVEVIDHDVHGKLIAIGDEEALYESIVAFIEKPKTAKKMGNTGRKVICTNFNIDLTAQCHILLFSSL